MSEGGTQIKKKKKKNQWEIRIEKDQKQQGVMICPEVADLRKQHSYTASESECASHWKGRVINTSQLDSES